MSICLYGFHLNNRNKCNLFFWIVIEWFLKKNISILSIAIYPLSNCQLTIDNWQQQSCSQQHVHHHHHQHYHDKFVIFLVERFSALSFIMTFLPPCHFYIYMFLRLCYYVLNSDMLKVENIVNNLQMIKRSGKKW